MSASFADASNDTLTCAAHAAPSCGMSPTEDPSAGSPAAPEAGRQLCPSAAAAVATATGSAAQHGDVERFDGKIVYNPDGSAYIIDTCDDDLPMTTEPGSIVDGRGSDSGAVALPKIASAFYISRNPALYSALYGQAYASMLLEKRIPEVPIVHSYRVFSVRDEGGVGEGNNPEANADGKLRPPLVDYSTVPIKPILMCFVCKLSFGSVKTFVSHAVCDHGVPLSEEERNILTQKNTSAILVTIGTDRRPSVSFLEPMAPPSERKSLDEPVQRPSDCATMPPVSAAPAAQTPVSAASLLSDSKDNLPTSDNRAAQTYLSNVPHSSAGVDLSMKVSVKSSASLLPPPPPPPPVSSESGDWTTSSSAAALSAGVTSPTFSAPASTSGTVTGTTIGACPQHMNGRPADEDCLECDQIMSFTRSLGGQMAMMHSRNSCKTLKCPKCNWHYKYHETLEIHMKEKHPESETTCIYCITGQQHPRLARGETYTCGYKPYRCEVCNYSTTTKGNLSIHMQSDKHLNNMQELQNGGVPRDSQQRPPSNHSSCPTPSRSPIQISPLPAKPKQTFRCDVCNYETNVARNLRIHMTSEKHTHNIMVMQQNVKQMHQLSALQAQMQGGFDPAAMMQFQAALIGAEKMSGGGGGPEAALADLAFNQAMMFQMMAAGQIPSAAMQHREPHPLEQLMQERLEPPQEPQDTNPAFVFSCCTCSCFSCDTPEELVRHLSRDRSQPRDADVTIVAAGSSICRLCSYKTNLKANFQLHCKTDKHLQKLQHLNHIFEGGEANEWKLRYLNVTNPVQLRCNLCEFFTNSVHKLQVHASQQRHEISLVLFSYLRRAEMGLSEQRRTYSCALCRFTTRQKLPLLQHIGSPQHLQMEQLRQLQRQAEGQQGQDDIGAIFPVTEVDDESGGQPKVEKPRDLDSESQHSEAGRRGGEAGDKLVCPLCGEPSESRTHLEKHLLEAHRAREDVLQRLITLADQQSSEPSPSSENNATSERSNSKEAEKESIDVDEIESEELYRCQTCSRTFHSVDDLCQHQHEHGLFEIKQTPRGFGYLCSKKGCNQYFGHAQQMETHFREIHAKAEQIAAVSERHVYKYRCSQCSLAFKTVEKLQLHSQYHLIRDASKCGVCDRSFRSVPSLQKHLETAHPDVSEEEMSRHRAKLLSNPLLMAGLGGQVMDTSEAAKREPERDEEETPSENKEEEDDREHLSAEQRQIEDFLNTPAAAEDGYADQARKYKCHRCRVAYTRQSYLLAHNKTLLHRKGEKLSYPMEKYLDPNRPFKCDVCKESFTQKNILLVHYNSVSHLHKLKKSMQEAQTSPTSQQQHQEAVAAQQTLLANKDADDDRKPFRCNICKVSYGQSQTLDIHIRSVLHQSRAAKVPELLSAGLIDMSRPLIEAPDMTRQDQQRRALELLIGLKQQEAATEADRGTGLPTCNRCSAVFITADQLQQHQQLYCLAPNSGLNVLAALQLQSKAAQLQQEQQQRQQEQEQQPAPNGSSGTEISKQPENELPSPVEANEDTNVTPATPVRKTSHLQKHLLQTYGFEVVMQYNESHQKKKRLEEEENMDTGVEEEKEQVVPEVAKCLCPLCKKEFSSVWVLKAHTEEVHKTLVPRDVLEEYADIFKEEFQKKHHSSDNQQEKPCSPQPVASDKETPEAKTNVVDNPDKFEDSGITVNTSEQTESTTASTPTPSTESEQTPPKTSSAAFAPSSASTPPSSQRQQPPQQSSQQEQPQSVADMQAAINLIQAAHMHQQMQQMAQFASLSFPGFNPALAAMNLQPPLMPMMNPQQMFDPMTLLAAQAQAIAQQQQQQQHKASMVAPMLESAMMQHQLPTPPVGQQKRARTRISDEQLKILRAHFDINNSPSEDQINNMAQQTGLMPKVIKHWFRNTLFKERQRNKDSPYNFSVPPATTLNLEEYEKTGEAKVMPLDPSKEVPSTSVKSESVEIKQEPVISQEKTFPPPTPAVSSQSGVSLVTPPENTQVPPPPPPPPPLQPLEKRDKDTSLSEIATAPFNIPTNSISPAPRPVVTTASALSPTVSPVNYSTQSASPSPLSLTNILSSQLSQGQNVPPSVNTKFQPGYSGPPYGQSSLFPGLTSPSMNSYAQSPVSPVSGSSGQYSHGKRANRTRFTDYQIKVLQEFFENNAYPKDDDLEYLSKLLGLSPRVIVVWFQNARQKARKVYENQPPVDAQDENSGRFQRTAGLNYQCKKCMMVFQRYYELIRHQKQHCYKEEDAKRSAQAQAAASQVALTLSEDSNSNPALLRSVLPANISPFDTKPQAPVPQQESTFKCDKCSQQFSRFDQWREHQVIHLMNPNLFSNMTGGGTVEPSAPIQNIPPAPPLPSLGGTTSPKRKASVDEEPSEHGDNEDHPRDKRLRTTITPEQLEFLYQRYQLESNPSRKMLETIAQESGLKKRVVQVWFQNTRARERKGQFRAHAQVINKRCPFCPAIFKVKSALESHLSTKHVDQYSRGEINIESLPDIEDEVQNRPPVSAPSFDTGLDMRRAVPPPHVQEAPPAMAGIPSRPGEIPLDLSKPMRVSTEQDQRHGDGPLTDSSCDRSGDDYNIYMDCRSETGSMENERFSNNGSPTSSTASLVPPLSSSGVPSMAQTPQQAKPNKRYRTQMSQTQVKIMKQLFSEYKTPTMAECELLGSEIGLAKRVVQVWFQNARAKGKKQQQAQGLEPEMPKVPDQCHYCGFTYSHKYAIQDHIFTRKHIDNVRAAIENDRKTDGFYQPASAHTPAPAAPASAAPAATPATGHNTSTPPAEKQLPKNMSLLLQQMYGMATPMPPQVINSLVGGLGQQQTGIAESAESAGGGGGGAGAAPAADGDAAAGADVTFGTPLRLLQIPPHALAELRAALQSDGVSEARFTQDGCSAAGLRGVSEVDGESGAVCKLCHLVFPTEAGLTRHPCGGQSRLMLTQRQYQCHACHQQLPTRSEAVTHVNHVHGGGGGAGQTPAADVVDKLSVISALSSSKTLAGLGGTDTNGNFHHATATAAGAVRGEQ